MEKITTHTVVLGSGPGGYSAAFRAADLGLQVTLVEKFSEIGGVCLNVGCIPSKALLHVAKVKDEAAQVSEHGISFGEPTIDIDKVRAWKDSVITKLTSGLKAMSKQRKVNLVQGVGEFTGSNTLLVKGPEGETEITFENAIIAAGSRPIDLPFLPKDDRIINSTGALELKDVPEKMLVIGGGIIGLEMAQVYNALGSNISVVELQNQIFPGCDKDLVQPLMKRIKKQYDIMLETKVVACEAKEDGLWVTFEGKKAPAEPQRYDKILQSVGRLPNGKLIGAEKAGVEVDDRGFIASDRQQRTNVPHIYAIGDITSNPMLAHKAVPEGRLAAEVISGEKNYFEASVIPSVAYTDPEVAWVGVSEIQAKEQGLNYGKGAFPWAASGRALSMGREEGFTKVLFDKDTHRLIGCGITGSHAGDLIGQASLAIEMGCTAEDISLTIQPHPTLTETFMMATEVFEGTVTDLFIPKRKK